MATSVVALDTTQYVRVNIGFNPLVLQSTADEVFIVFNDTQPSTTNTARITLHGGDAPLSIPANDTNVWAWGNSNKAGLTVTEFTEASVRTTDGGWNRTIFDEYAHQHSGIFSTLAVATSPLGTDTTIQVQPGDGALFTVGDSIQISNGGFEPSHPLILVITGDVLTLDRPVDYGHPIGTKIEIVTTDISAVAGSLAAPIEYFVIPDGDDVVQVRRIIITLLHGTAGDLGKFGDLPPLVNGVVVRVKNGGQYRTLTNWKTNGDMGDDMYDILFAARSTGGGTYSTTGRWTFFNFNTVVRLDGSLGDALEFYVQDNLTGLLGFSIKAQGHTV